MGIMPDPEVWDEAQEAFDAAETYFSGNGGFLELPPELRGIHSALGALLGIYQGYGED